MSYGQITIATNALSPENSYDYIFNWDGNNVELFGYSPYFVSLDENPRVEESGNSFTYASTNDSFGYRIHGVSDWDSDAAITALNNGEFIEYLNNLTSALVDKHVDLPDSNLLLGTGVDNGLSEIDDGTNNYYNRRDRVGIIGEALILTFDTSGRLDADSSISNRAFVPEENSFTNTGLNTTTALRISDLHLEPSGQARNNTHRRIDYFIYDASENAILTDDSSDSGLELGFQTLDTDGTINKAWTLDDGDMIILAYRNPPAEMAVTRPNMIQYSWGLWSLKMDLITKPSLTTIAQEDFDGSLPSWPNDISSQIFEDPSSPDEGLFIQISTNIGSGLTAFGKDLEGEVDEPTLSPFTFTFEEVIVANFSDINLSFDYYASAAVDSGSYQLILDGIPQSAVEFYNDPSATPVQGTITETIGTATSVGLILTGTLNGASEVIEFDNFRLQGNYDGELIYASGVWIPNPPSASTGADDALIQDGIFTSSSDLSLNSISVLNGASLKVNSTDVLTVNTALYNNGSMTFLSDALGSAQLDAFTGVLYGDITVERYISNKRAYRLLSSPVEGQTFADAWQQDTHITGSGGATNGFDATETNSSSLFSFNNSTVSQTGGNSWEALGNTDVNTITAGTAYRLFVRGDRSIDLTDNNATASVTTLHSTGSMHTGSYSPTLASTASNYSFVGNPYQATVNLNAVTRTNLTDFIYVWDASIAGVNGKGGYVTVSLPTGAPSPSSSDASEFIAPGQAFFVQNTAAGNGSITFEEADKATSETQVTVFSSDTNFYINSRLYKTEDLHSGAMESDAIGLRFNENFTTLGSDEDANKLANPGENYAIVNNGYRAIDQQNIPTAGHLVQLFLANYKTSNYSLTFNLNNQPEDLIVYLNDSYLETQTELVDTSVYDFTVDANVPESIASNRFELLFEEVALSNENFNPAQVRLYPNPVLNTLELKLPDGLDIKDLVIFNIQGQEIIRSQHTSVDVTNLTSGIYLVEITTAQGKLTKKIIKQ